MKKNMRCRPLFLLETIISLLYFSKLKSPTINMANSSVCGISYCIVSPLIAPMIQMLTSIPLCRSRRSQACRIVLTNGLYWSSIF
jgi:hypothetical protein